jgi:hypothetical protein
MSHQRFAPERGSCQVWNAVSVLTASQARRSYHGTVFDAL